MKFIKSFLIRLVANWVTEPVLQYFETIKWTRQDAMALDDYLKTESGQKFINAVGQNSSRCLHGILNTKTADESEKIKGQASAWLALVNHIKLMRTPMIDQKDPKEKQKRDDAQNKKLEEQFSRMISGCMNVTGSAVMGKRTN